MKYRKIYTVIENHPGVHVNDRSYWRSNQQGYMAMAHPLNIIIEAPKAGLRIWVNHECGGYRITTADMTLDCKSREYHLSFCHIDCRNQADMAEKLEGLLSSGKESSDAA